MSEPMSGKPSAAAHPESIRRLPDGGVEIGWSDGVRSAYSPRLLRQACPCATCREERAAPKPKGLLQVLSPQELVPLSIAWAFYRSRQAGGAK